MCHQWVARGLEIGLLRWEHWPSPIWMTTSQRTQTRAGPSKGWTPWQHGWAVPTNQVQGPSAWPKCLGMTWEAVQHLIPDEIATKHLALSDPKNRTEAQELMVQFTCWCCHLTCVGILIAPITRLPERPLPLSGAPVNRTTRPPAGHQASFP